MDKLLSVGMFLFNEVELLDIVEPFEVFSVTAELNNYQRFNVFTITENGGKIRTVNGLQVVADYDFTNHPPIDLLITERY